MAVSSMLLKRLALESPEFYQTFMFMQIMPAFVLENERGRMTMYNVLALFHTIHKISIQTIHSITLEEILQIHQTAFVFHGQPQF